MRHIFLIIAASAALSACGTDRDTTINNTPPVQPTNPTVAAPAEAKPDTTRSSLRNLKTDVLARADDTEYTNSISACQLERGLTIGENDFLNFTFHNLKTNARSVAALGLDQNKTIALLARKEGGHICLTVSDTRNSKSYGACKLDSKLFKAETVAAKLRNGTIVYSTFITPTEAYIESQKPSNASPYFQSIRLAYKDEVLSSIQVSSPEKIWQHKSVPGKGATALKPDFYILQNQEICFKSFGAAIAP